MCVCVSAPRLLIISGVMWCDIDPIRLVKIKFYGFLMAVIVDIVSGCDVSIHTHHGNWPSKGKLVLYKPLLHCNNHLKQL